MTAPIIGARNLEQLEVSLVAANFKMTKDMYAEIASLSRAPAYLAANGHSRVSYLKTVSC